MQKGENRNRLRRVEDREDLIIYLEYQEKREIMEERQYLKME